jgi:hypothetical protein
VAAFTLPPEAVEEYRQAYIEAFGIHLSKDEALVRATKLMDLFRIVYGRPCQECRRPSSSSNEGS